MVITLEFLENVTYVQISLALFNMFHLMMYVVCFFLYKISHSYVYCVLVLQGVHCTSTVNIHVHAQKGYYLEQAWTRCTYKRHIAIKQEVDIHEVGDKAIEKYM